MTGEEALPVTGSPGIVVVDIAASVDDVVAESLAGLSKAGALTRSH